MSTLPNEFKRDMALVNELNAQSDRGAAVIATAWVEEELQQAIHSILHPDKKSWERLFGRSGPLATFSAKIDIASLLGMIDAAVRSDLHTIRDIRNEFAHSVVSKSDEALAFGTPHIRDKCMSLRVSAHREPKGPREAFLQACAVLNADFHLCAIVAKPSRDIHQVKVVPK